MKLSQMPEIGRLLTKNSRPQNVLYSGLLASMAVSLVGGSRIVAVGSYLLVLLLYALATSYNNYHDIDTDTINRRTENPFVANILTATTLKVFIAACFALIIVLQLMLRQPATLVLVAVYLALAVLYSYPVSSLKSRGLLATILLAICYGVIPLLIGLAQSALLGMRPIIVLCSLQVLVLFPVLLAKDYKDRAGDFLTGKQTPLVKYGPKMVRWLAVTCGLGASLLLLFIVSQQGVAIFAWAEVLAICYIVGVTALHLRAGKIIGPVRLGLSLAILAMSYISITLYV